MIDSNTFAGTQAFEGGGLSQCNGSILNNWFIDNRAQDNLNVYGYLPYQWTTPGAGSAMSDCDGAIYNNTIVTDDTHSVLAECNGSITNNIIWNANPLTTFTLVNCSTPTYCLIRDWTGGGAGNISDDPRFVDPAGLNFHLRADSPAIDAGRQIAGMDSDADGDARPYLMTSDARGDGSGYDIGADELGVNGQAWLLRGSTPHYAASDASVYWSQSPDGGTAITLYLVKGGRSILYLGEFWSPSGDDTVPVHLPATLGTADDYAVRVTSTWDIELSTQSTPVTVEGTTLGEPTRAAAGANWTLYQ